MAPSHASTHHHLVRHTQALRVQWPMMLRRRFEEDVGRRGGLGEYFRCVDLAVELAELKMISSASLVHKVNTQINVLGALITANQALRPGDARFIVSKDTGLCSLRIAWIAKISQEFVKINHLLNHGWGRNELCFGWGQSHSRLPLGAARSAMRSQHRWAWTQSQK